MITWADVALVVAATGAVAVLGGGAGALLLSRLRRRPLRVSLAVIVLTVVLVVAAPVGTVGALMLVTGHALVVLLASVVAAALAGLAVAALLGRQVERGSRALQARLRAIGSDAAPGPVAEPDGTPGSPGAAELADLSAELAAAQGRLAEAGRRQAALEASRRELVAWVSHDLRTPLADVRAMAEALEDGVVVDEDSVRAYHRGIRSEADRLSAMVGDLFELSRIQAGAVPLTLGVVDLAAVVATAAEPAREQARRRGVTLVVHAEAPAPVVGDEARLTRAVRNLVANAVRHTGEGGQVTVAVEPQPDATVLLTVADGCGGIAEADLPRVFEVGFRGEHARTPGPDHGAGLGLAIARGLVEAHEGTLTVGNAPPGCRFALCLPAARPTVPGGAVRAGRGSGSPPQGPS